MGWVATAQPFGGGASGGVAQPFGGGASAGGPLSTKERAGEEVMVVGEVEGEEERRGNSVPHSRSLRLREGKCGSQSSDAAHFGRHEVVLMVAVEAEDGVPGAVVAGRAHLSYQVLQSA